jgi:translation initiation factor 2 alpha subunit (eIF-2alpha)
MEIDTELIVAAVGFVAAGAGAWWAKKRRSALKAMNEWADSAEEAIEELTGIDVELNEVVEEALEAAENAVESAVDTLEEGGSLDDVAEEIIEDLNENLEATLSSMTVTVLRDMLKERGLPVSGRKAELIQRLLEA